MPTPRKQIASPSCYQSNSRTCGWVMRALWLAPTTCAMACLVLTLASCVERTVSVTSEPAGALVYLNDEEVGRTPVSVPFTFYGTYGVRLQHDGYVSLNTTQKAKAPWWEFPGPDLIGELIPNNHVNIAWHFKLEKQAAADPDKIIDHASQMRTLLRQDSLPLDTQVKESDQPTPQPTSPASTPAQ